MTKPRARPYRGFVFEAGRVVSLFFFRLAGWRVEGDVPLDRKMVVIAAPHTSNWDLPFMLAVSMYYRAPLRWMGKASLVTGPFGWLMRWLGCIPIDRSKANDVVSQMVDVFAAADDMLVAIPPEGTRSKVRYWKTGFYNIAHGAGVPVAFGFLDYKRKVGGISQTLTTTGDYDEDLKRIRAFYDEVPGKFPAQYGDPPD